MRWLISIALVFLVGCSTVVPDTRVITVRDEVPASLLARCPAPDIAIENNGDLARAYIGTRQALEACDADKAALQEWNNNRKED